MIEFLWLLGGLLVGAVVVGLVMSLVSARRLAAVQAGLAAEQATVSGLRTTAENLERGLGDLRAERDEIARERDAARSLAETARIETARVEADLRVAREKHDEFVRGAEDARKKLEEMFKALAADVLQANQKQFIESATAHFEKAQKQIGGHLGERHVQLEEMLKPFREQISKQQEILQQLEVKREKAYTSIEEHVQRIAESHQSLRQETGRLVTALRRPEQRGRWGEMQLRNIVELAGMVEHCDFAEQVSVTTDENERLRPDMVVNLPGGGTIVVDSKVALDAYLDAIECDDDTRRRDLMGRHATAVEAHVKGLADKRYWKQFERTPKVVVMFLPIESGFTAALEQKPELQMKAMENHVLIATPTLLVGLLRSIAFGWQQEDVAANAREIQKAGAAVYDHLSKFAGHFAKVGERLRQGTEAYNRAVGSLETRLLPAARRIKAMGATRADDLPEPAGIEIETRSVVKEELLDAGPAEPKTPAALPSASASSGE
jgi:DNA recombination protein RmuC